MPPVHLRAVPGYAADQTSSVYIPVQGISTCISMNSAWRFTIDRNAREHLRAHSRVGQQEFSDVQPQARALLLHSLFKALTRDLHFTMADGFAAFKNAFEDEDRACFWPDSLAVVELSTRRDFSATPPVSSERH